MGSDGLEPFLTIHPEEENFDAYVARINSLISDEDPIRNDAFYRIIRDHRWHLLIPVNNHIGRGYNPGQRVIIRDPVTEKEIRGRIINNVDDFNNEEILLMVELDQRFDEWQSKRVYHFSIVHQRQEGLLVPITSVMTENDGSKSVLKIDVNGYAVKRQVRELAHNETTSVLKEGTITIPSIEPEGHETEVQSINQYDEIITNPEVVAEGQKVR